MKILYFKSLLQWINEQESSKKEQSYGCIMMDTKIKDWEENHLKGIDEKDIYEDPLDDSYGLEENPHVTILYGIHEDEVDPELIKSVIENNMYPIEVTIDEIDVFENDKYDVVKYNIPVTNDLKKFRKLFEKNFPNTQTYDDYHPHITIAYVKSGTGKKYKRKLQHPFNVTFDKALYSYHDEEKPDGKVRSIVNLDTDESFVNESHLVSNNTIWWHGSTDKNLKGKKGIHVGTKLAATQALQARIGVPAYGEWDGTRKYGETLLAGKKNLEKKKKELGYYCDTGYNCGEDVPEKDYYPDERKYRAKYSDYSPISFNSMPIVFPVKIIGNMTNTPNNPHSDAVANGLIRRQLNKGITKSGYYYENIGEDEGSISAVVPNSSFLEILK